VRPDSNSDAIIPWTGSGFGRNDTNWIDPHEIVFRLVDVVSKGGNYLREVAATGAPSLIR